jgi:hypothetical protein
MKSQCTKVEKIIIPLTIPLFFLEDVAQKIAHMRTNHPAGLELFVAKNLQYSQFIFYKNMIISHIYKRLINV